jgi:TPR repeat protein
MRRLLLAPLVLLALVGRSHADDPMDSDRVKEALRDMDMTSTWYHDDLFGEYAGFRRYAQKQYQDALHYFELGAFYADKPSQIGIGLMYLKGEGVAADPVTAFAWLDLAAERGYPT